MDSTSMSDLGRAVRTIVEDCVRVRAGEEVLVVVDPTTRDLGEALRQAASDARADALLLEMAERGTHGAEPPSPVAAALNEADVFLAPTAKSLSHTRARKRACEAGARGANMPGVTSEMLARVMAVDFSTLRERSQQVARLLDDASTAVLTCPGGSDMTFDLQGRAGLPDDGDLSRPGAFGNLPCGEGFISPAGGAGRLVAACLAAVGLTTDAALLRVEDGGLTHAEGPEGERFAALLSAHGSSGTNLAELGVGTNDRATLTGNVLEDEKILGTVHVAFGASAAIGGTVSVPVHLDCVVLEPTLTLDGHPLVQDGRLQLP